MKQDWKFFAKALVLPVFFFLSLDFLYRLSEMNVARDAWLSFAFLETAGVVLAGVLAFFPAILIRFINPRAQTVIRCTAATASIWCLLFLFLIYLKGWVFSFTLADEMGRIVIKTRYLLLASLMLIAIPVFVFRKRNRLRDLEAFVSLGAGRIARLVAAVTVASLATVAFTLFQAAATAHAGLPPVNSTPKKPPNVLLLVFDTLSARHLSAYNDKVNPTPHFDHWAREGLFFRNARANVTSTGPSITSLLTGKSPLKSHILGYHPVPGAVSEENLLSYLESRNFNTTSSVEVEFASVAFHGLPTPTNGDYRVYFPPAIDAIDCTMTEGARRLGFSLKFQIPGSEYLSYLLPIIDTINHSFKFRIPQIVMGNVKPFTETFDGMITLLKNKDRLPRSSFVYVHIYFPSRIVHDSNIDITPTTYPRYYEPSEQPKIDQERQNYDRAVTEWDEALGSFLDNLKESGILEKTIIAITADHGESFAGGFWGHGDDLSEDSIQVPFLILTPSQRSETITAPVQTCDIAPTLLTLLNLPIPDWMDGISALAGLPRHEAVTFNYPIRTPLRTRIPFPGLTSGRSISLYEDSFKFIKRPDGNLDERFDLDQDPEESKNLAPQETEKAEEMKRRLMEILQAAGS